MSNTRIENLQKAWQTIAPSWPLQSLIAVNPLQGLESLPIEDAMAFAARLFEEQSFPQELTLINRLTIKWVQAFFDQGQATITMPGRTKGLYHSWKTLVCFDDQLHNNDPGTQELLRSLPKSSLDAIDSCLKKLKISSDDELLFLTLTITTLPGWAAYIKYQSNWAQDDQSPCFANLQHDYLAIRLIMMTILWPQAADIVVWHNNLESNSSDIQDRMHALAQAESDYITPVLQALTKNKMPQNNPYNAQIAFCIDVRSEPLRRALETIGNYQTFGCAGFFNIPVRIENSITKTIYNSCPVLVKPEYTVQNIMTGSEKAVAESLQEYQSISRWKKVYQAIAYTFTTPFVLVDFLGAAAGLWMMLKSLAPAKAVQLKHFLIAPCRPKMTCQIAIDTISFKDQCKYAYGALQSMGLTDHFAPLILFCGHGSATQNNAFATALDCGACAGHHGGSNAQILAKILNRDDIRNYLSKQGINIPSTTTFIAGQHTTTTDQVIIYNADSYGKDVQKSIRTLQQDLNQAGKINSRARTQDLISTTSWSEQLQDPVSRSLDWAQVRPEWGLAGNAAFIIADRMVTKNINLQGRAFLHSYDYTKDTDGLILEAIMTAPMIVGQWINSQYLFSTLDNVAYGAGNKITKNITGKFGFMQGNASDLMHGLPLQSVYIDDTTAYHQMTRLTAIIHAPCISIDKIIDRHTILKNLFCHGWMHLIAIDPTHNDEPYILDRNLEWKRTSNR